MIKNNIINEIELFSIADEKKKEGKKILQILLHLAQQKHWVTYLKIPGRWSLQSKNVFAQSKPAWKWFMSIHLEDVQTPVVEYGWTVL